MRQGGGILKRWALRILVFLLLGAIVNVAVAWGSSNLFGAKFLTQIVGSNGVKSEHWLPSDFEQGWPCRSLTHDTAEWRPRAWSVRLGSFDIWMANRPIWPGFAMNTVFDAGVLWLLVAAPFALRRRRRIKRGLCPKCAYDLRGRDSASHTCPECGAAMTVGQRAAAS